MDLNGNASKQPLKMAQQCILVFDEFSMENKIWNNQTKQDVAIMSAKTAHAYLGNIGREIAKKLAKFFLELALTHQ